MANRQSFLNTTTFLLLLATIVGPSGMSLGLNGEPKMLSGLRTDRLSPRQLRIWQSIRDVVLACDQSGQPLHPKLYSLWRSADESGHLIFIELQKEAHHATPYIAGEFVIEKVDQAGQPHVLAVRIFLSTIDRASTSNGALREDGFVPFRGLFGAARYAEALGHELTHIVLMFQNAEYLRLQMESGKARTALLSQGHDMRADQQYTMASLTRAGEEPANLAEVEIWHELRASSSLRRSRSRPAQR